MQTILLKDTIDYFYQQQKINNPFFIKSENGTFTPQNLESYLCGILYLISKTPYHLNLAKNRSLEESRDSLATFYSKKIIEESGHDKWAEEDTNNLHAKFDKLKTSSVSTHIVDLVNFLEKTINENPELYLAYVLFTEYITVIAGPEWISNLTKKCGIDRNMISVIDKHAELDKVHVLDDIKEIETLLLTKSPDELLIVLKKAMAYFEGFYMECGNV